MSKTTYFKCNEKGCPEHISFKYTMKWQLDELKKTYHKKWKCDRHKNPDKVLNQNNLKKQTILICGKSKKYPELKNLYWQKKNDLGLGLSFIKCVDFIAFANDFPEGTELIITAEVKIKKIIKKEKKMNKEIFIKEYEIYKKSKQRFNCIEREYINKCGLPLEKKVNIFGKIGIITERKIFYSEDYTILHHVKGFDENGEVDYNNNLEWWSKEELKEK